MSTSDCAEFAVCLSFLAKTPRRFRFILGRMMRLRAKPLSLAVSPDTAPGKMGKRRRGEAQSVRLFISAVIIVAVSVVVIAQSASAITTSQAFTYPGAATWVCPAGITHIQVECWGGGGAGGGSPTGSTTGSRSGGAGGGYAIRTNLLTIPGNTYFINVGAGGTGATNGPPNDGGDSWFSSAGVTNEPTSGAANCVASGGAGASNSVSGGNGLANSARMLGDYFYLGGNGGRAASSTGNAGGGGGGAGAGGAGTNGVSGQAVGGGPPNPATGLGAGGAGGKGSAGSGNQFDGSAPGGAGGGCKIQGVGGDGAAGQVVLTYEEVGAGGGKFLVPAGPSSYSINLTNGISAQGAATLRAGADDSAPAGGRNPVLVFLLPVLGNNAVLADAKLRFFVPQTYGGRFLFNLELCGLGFSNSTPPISGYLATWPDPDSNHDLIQFAMLTPVSSANTTYTTAGPNLTAYLRSFYDGHPNYKGGSSVFLRFNPDSDPGSSAAGFDLASAGYPVASNQPVLMLTTATNLGAAAITIAKSQTGQTLWGIGAASVNGAALRSYPTNVQAQVLDQLFLNSSTNAGFSIVRMSVNPDIWPTQAGQPVWSADTGQQWFAQQAKNRGCWQFMAMPWSPPAWMKSTTNTIGGYLLTNYFNVLPGYVYSWATQYTKAYGLPIKYVSVQNEPNVGEVNWDCCTYDYAAMDTMAGLVADYFHARGSPIMIGAPESGRNDSSVAFLDNMTNNFGKLDYVPTHNYGSPDQSLVGFGKPTLCTEYYKKTANYFSISDGMNNASFIYTNVTRGEVGYLHWEFLTTENSANPAGLIQLTNKTFIPTPRFYVFAQYSRALRPGDLYVNSTSSDPDLQVVAAIDPTNALAKVVVANQGTADLTAVISGFGDRSFLSVYQTSATNGMQPLPALKTSAGAVTYAFPAQSVTTLLEGALPAIAISATGSQLALRWPTNYPDWLLQSNAVTLRDTNSWFTVPGAGGTNQPIIDLNATRPKVFYRLVHP